MPKKKKSPSTTKLSPGDILHVDPARIRYQHSRIRPHFSGCGRPLHETLDELRRGALRVQDLPLIQVLVGPDENDGLGPWYFSLNNRRLWVWKRLREEGLLEGGVVPVRVREAKSRGERERYTLENCVVEAKIVCERSGGGGKSSKREEGETAAEEVVKDVVSDQPEVEAERQIMDSDDESTDSEEEISHSNPFSALMMG